MGSGSYKQLLAARNFRALLIAQFTGALNDNLYRMVASLFAVGFIGGSRGAGYVALAGVLFIVPFLTLSGMAGRLADSVGKRRLLIAAKFAEVLVMALGMLAFYLHSVELIMVALFLMATQSTFFSPARYGILPELVARRDLSRANGLGEMSMYAAIVLGSALGGAIFELWRDQLHYAALPMIAVSGAGVIASLRVAVPSPHQVRRAQVPPSRSAIVAGLCTLRDVPALGLAVLAVSLFWALGAMTQYDVLFYGKNVLGLGEADIGLLQANLGLGIGAGCLFAGWRSGDRVHLGLAQIGMAGVGTAFIILGILPPSPVTTFIAIGAAGFAGGLFVVPMISLMHQRAPQATRGQLFATNNFLNMLDVLLGIAAVFGLHDLIGVGPAGVFVAIGSAALLAAAASLSSRVVLAIAHPGIYVEDPVRAAPGSGDCL